MAFLNCRERCHRTDAVDPSLASCRSLVNDQFLPILKPDCHPFGRSILQVLVYAREMRFLLEEIARSGQISTQR